MSKKYKYQFEFDPQEVKKWELDDGEKELIASMERGEWTTADDNEKKIKMLKEAAKNTIENFKKDTKITIRISSYDLHKLKKKAIKEGIKYQTLLGSMIHKFVSQTDNELRA
ncbi:MAG: antitoxin [Elusimicrobiota bacterium]|jgi:predicted DNA binding CopG/RHH family protein|nr:antitoxin [Elusimicrobiota bacterium]